MTVQSASNLDQLTFRMNPSLQLDTVLAAASPASGPLAFTSQPGHDEDGQPVQLVTVSVTQTLKEKGEISLVWDYHGTVNDPPREPRHLRFVTPSETSGHIGSEGVYLSAETHWYPHLPGSLATFTVRVKIPEGWKSVTHGKRIGAGSSPDESEASQRTMAQSPIVVDEWEVAEKTEALTLVANRFVETSTQWGDVQVATFLFPDDAALAQEYLDASIEYLQAYSKLLGRYPFQKFAVVENFFASGLGMPSFTLLGSSVIKRHYVQPYALGHEIVHSWLGNWVLNEPKTGNWVEGLTTYLANYYFDELKGRLNEAREQRRMMVIGYAVYVWPEEDYAVAQFQRKHDQRDNAIGYQKTAMVFHMLRREIGEEAFWQAIRSLIREQAGRYTAWADLVRIFTQATGRDLQWFFDQWVERPGAPMFELQDIHTRPGTNGFQQVQGRVIQRGIPYRGRVPVWVELETGEIRRTEVMITSPTQDFMLSVAGVPRHLRLDPDFEVFQRLDRQELPPMLNLYVTDRQRSVIPPSIKSEAGAPYHELASRLRSQAVKGQELPAILSALDPIPRGSVLVLGGLDVNPAASEVAKFCGDTVSLSRDGFSVGGQSYKDSEVALLISCRHPQDPASVLTLFYGTTPQSATKVARLLFFYGWQSYVVFRGGSVAARGDFSPPVSRLETVFRAK